MENQPVAPGLSWEQFSQPILFPGHPSGRAAGALTHGLCSVPPVLSPVLPPDNSSLAQAKQNPSHSETELISENPAPPDLPADSGRDK